MEQHNITKIAETYRAGFGVLILGALALVSLFFLLVTAIVFYYGSPVMALRPLAVAVAVLLVPYLLGRVAR